MAAVRLVSVMGIRAYLREVRVRFGTQEEMADYITQHGGKYVSQSMLSLWLSDQRYPDPTSRQAIRRAFKVSPRRWAGMLLVDEEEAASRA